MNKKVNSRVDHESSEQLEEVKNSVPENKFQATQQVAETDDAIKTSGKESSFTATKEKMKGATLKQEAIADMIGGSASAAGMGISGGGRGVSGTNGGILGANNSTPIADKSRSTSRVGKKLDRTATKLNFTPSEQVIVQVDESKPLADASTEDQGYNGTYRNEAARSQKVAGAVPGDLMFQRSVDLITNDKLYFVEGQQVFQNSSDRTNLNPTLSSFGEEEYDATHSVTYTSGNFLHRGLHFDIDEQGKVDYFYADVEDLTPASPVDAEIANVSSAHRLIKSNVAEIDRQIMDSKAGDEKADLWSPLGRAVHQPTQNAYLLSSIEAETGAYAHLAYSKASTNMAYQLNRGPKDGLNEVGPAIEQLVGWRSTETDSSNISSEYYNSLANVFDIDSYKKGDPSLMIAAYDSVAKYKNKADLLLQPRGFRMHLQTADNNINPLKVPTEYAKVFAGQETFSTIDHEYDPILPICMTDKANLITVHNFNELAGFAKIMNSATLTFSSTNIEDTYLYTNKRLIPAKVLKALGYDNMYVYVKVTSSDGVVYDSTNKIITMDPDSTNRTDSTIDFIITSDNTTTPTGYTLLVTYATDSTKDLIFRCPKVQNYTDDDNDTTVITAADFTIDGFNTYYHKNAGPYAYVYSDLRNYYYIDVKHPLIEGIIEYLNNTAGGKFRSLLGGAELYIPMVFSTQYMTLAQLIICAATPWITRVRINSMKDVIYYEDNFKEYPFSKLDSIKNVPFHNYTNFGYNGYDEPLECRRMDPAVAIQWVMPEFFWKVGASKYVLPWYFNENEFVAVSDGKISADDSAMSFPSVRSGVRLGNLDLLYSMTEKDVRLSLDRLTKFILNKDSVSVIKSYKYGRNTDGQPYVELSDSDVFSVKDYLSCPRELGLVCNAPYGLFTYTNNVPSSLTAEVCPAFEIKIWTNPNTQVNPSILGNDGVNINRAANYTQKWMKICSADSASDTVLAGLVFGMNDEGAATFKPFGALSTGNQYSSGPDIISLQRSLWTRLQLLPFVISPFDGHSTSGAGVRDIYDIAYMFGLCGFRASDYRESTYNREKEAVNQGLLFINDPWVIASPIIREAAASTGLSNAKGYEIKKD